MMLRYANPQQHQLREVEGDDKSRAVSTTAARISEKLLPRRVVAGADACGRVLAISTSSAHNPSPSRFRFSLFVVRLRLACR